MALDDDITFDDLIPAAPAPSAEPAQALSFDDLVPAAPAGRQGGALSFDDLIPTTASAPSGGGVNGLPFATTEDEAPLSGGMGGKPAVPEWQPGAVADRATERYADVSGPGWMSQVGPAFVTGAKQSAVDAAWGFQRAGRANVLSVMDRIDRGEQLDGRWGPYAERYAGMTPDQRQQERARLDRQWQRAEGAASQRAEAEDKAPPVDPRMLDHPLVKTASIVGGAMPYLAAAAVGMPFGAGAAMGTALGSGAVLGAAQSFETTYKDAKANGASDDEAYRAANVSALVNGGLMSVASVPIFTRLPLPIQNEIVAAASRFMASGATFVGLTQAQGFVNNLIARATYEPDRPMSQGLGQDVTETALAGFILHAPTEAAGAARYVRGAVRPPQAAPELQRNVEAMTEAAARANERAPGQDVGAIVPEAPETLAAQMQQLAEGRRPAVLIPRGTPNAPSAPDGMQRADVPDGVVYFDPRTMTPEAVAQAAAANRLNDILALGPVNKAEAQQRAAAGETPVAVTERTPDGVEVKAAAGTDKTAPAQAEALEANKTPGNTVQVEPPESVLAGRRAAMPPAQRAYQFFVDRGWTTEQAAGFVANGHAESGFDHLNRTGDGGRSWGVFQWSPERRAAIEKQFGIPFERMTFEQQLEAAHWELTQGPEQRAGRMLREARTPAEAAEILTRYYERPADPDGQSRARAALADRYAGALRGEGDMPTLARVAGDRVTTPSEAADTAARRDLLERSVFTAAGREVRVAPEITELRDLIASHTDDGRINPGFPHDLGLQPRDRSTAASQAQIRQGAANLQPERLMPGVDAGAGAPIIGPNGVVESGNGRTLMLRQVFGDPTLSNQRNAYIEALRSGGYDVSGFQQPVLVQRRLTEMQPPELRDFVNEANERSTLAMNAAEQARSDARRVADALPYYQDGAIEAAGNREFVRAFMQSLPTAERGAMMLPDGRLSPDGQRRIQGAVMAHAYGDQMGVTLNRFLNTDAEGVRNLAGAMGDAAGAWAKMREDAASGRIPAELDITPALAQAVETVARARELNRPVKELADQVDLERAPLSPEAQAVLRAMFRDDALRRPVARDKFAERLTRYAEEAQRQQAGDNLFGEPPAPPMHVLRATEAERPAQDRMLSLRDQKASDRHAAARADDAQISDDARAARLQLYDAMQATMRFFGLPADVGLRLVDRIVDNATGRSADAQYDRRLITFALDTPPDQVAGKLAHEVIHALRDRDLALLTDGQRRALDAGADRWLAQDNRRAEIARRYGVDSKDPLVREEAVARMMEERLAGALKPTPVVRAAMDRMANFVRGVGQALRGEGFRTADDVFRALMTGEMQAKSGVGEDIRRAGDVPRYFSLRQEDPEQTRLQLLAPLREVVTASRNYLTDLRTQMWPMTGGNTFSRASASRYANAVADINDRMSIVSERIRKEFKVPERARIWRAMDAQGAFEIMLRNDLRELPMAERAEFERRAREAFGRSGVDGLTPREREVADSLNDVSKATWQKMQEVGMVPEWAQGIPYYTPRFIVTPDMEPARLGKLSELGYNFSTRAPQRREIIDLNDFLRVIKEKFGPNARVTEDVLTLPLQLARQERAVAARQMVNAVKEFGEQTGIDLITTGRVPPDGPKYVEIDHPAFREWRVDDEGREIQVPMKIHEDFAGPLRAILREAPRNKIMDGLLRLKYGVTGLIMISPLTHGAVVYSKAMPYAPGSVASFRMYYHGNRVRTETTPEAQDYRTYLHMHGLRPIGGSFFATEAGLSEGRAWEGGYSSRAVGKVVRAMRGEEAGRRAEERMMDVGRFWHRTLLWDRVADLQYGLADTLARHLIHKGVDRDTATYIAAHEANRAVGALPREAMAEWGNAAANHLLFSRSFTLGNLGIYKDAINGGPAYLKAQIEQTAGPEALRQAERIVRRNTWKAIAFDLGLLVITNSIMQSMVNLLGATPTMGAIYGGLGGMASGAALGPVGAVAGGVLGAIGGFNAAGGKAPSQEDIDKEIAGYRERLRKEMEFMSTNPMEWINPVGSAERVSATNENEPGRRNRIFVGIDETGRGLYVRNMLGKFGEDLIGWNPFWGNPVKTAQNKLSPILRPLLEDMLNRSGFSGKPIYNEDAHRVDERLANLGYVVQHLVSNALPGHLLQGIPGIARAVQGEGGAREQIQAFKTIGGLLGTSFSSGATGGPEAGEAMAANRAQQFRIDKAKPEAFRAFDRGNEDEAMRILTEAAGDPVIAAQMLRSWSREGPSPGAMRRYYRQEPAH